MAKSEQTPNTTSEASERDGMSMDELERVVGGAGGVPGVSLPAVQAGDVPGMLLPAVQAGGVPGSSLGPISAGGVPGRNLGPVSGGGVPGLPLK